eukprot:scaffold95917_cov31-Tisochrysis_lutea.AAC.1
MGRPIRDGDQRPAESPTKINSRDSGWVCSVAKPPPMTSNDCKWLKASEYATILDIGSAVGRP